ncbi:flagellar FliL protein [Virgibacillus halotolerans]|uniref:flagellar basal body-associated protein FliL n=1 Tax=Virgibacillus halotolerans TaxID=1071053 RepID=UPI00195FE4A3|nr:flagellar basal body-associated protein FliL [Virgibacillus halotolerans]MBM7598587.1 flagellar FliL protein [Virgibacillus halotolerans]
MRKLVKVMLTSLAILLACGIAGFIVVLNMKDEPREGDASIDDVVAYSYETPEMTTDLEDGSFVRIQFQMLTDGKAAQKEISKRDFQIKNIIIKELAEMDEADFKSGLTDLEKMIRDKTNEVMTAGKVTDVYTISKILQ